MKRKKININNNDINENCTLFILRRITIKLLIKLIMMIIIIIKLK